MIVSTSRPTGLVTAAMAGAEPRVVADVAHAKPTGIVTGTFAASP